MINLSNAINLNWYSSNLVWITIASMISLVNLLRITADYAFLTRTSKMQQAGAIECSLLERH